MLCGDQKFCCVEHVTHKVPHTCHNTITLTMVDVDPELIEMIAGVKF
jgi:hypothetical protein